VLTITYDQVDRKSAWFGVEEARSKLLKGQVPFLDRLAETSRTAS